MSDETYDWFGPESVQQLYNKLASADLEHTRLEVRRQPEHLTLHVISGAATTDDTPVNNSFRCPPVCP